MRCEQVSDLGTRTSSAVAQLPFRRRRRDAGLWNDVDRQSTVALPPTAGRQQTTLFHKYLPVRGILSNIARDQFLQLMYSCACLKGFVGSNAPKQMCYCHSIDIIDVLLPLEPKHGGKYNHVQWKNLRKLKFITE